MNIVRAFVVVVYVVAFFIALKEVSELARIPELGLTAAFVLVYGLSGVLLSIFVYIDWEQIEKLRKITKLEQKEKEELEFLPDTEDGRNVQSLPVQQFFCDTCLYFGKRGLCPSRERNPSTIACVYYRKKP